jgi:hypothetical protein
MSMVARRLVLVTGSLGSVVGLLSFTVPTTAVAATGGGLCQLAGTASFSPGLSSTAGNFTYSFAGSLSGCQSNDATAPTSGTVEAGETVTVPYTWSYVDPATGQTLSGTANATYQEPVPTGSGGCSNSATSGVSIANWADGTRTVVSYATTGAAAAVNLSGSVVPSVTLSLASFTGPTQAPPASTLTETTTRDAGDTAQGLLAFQPPDPSLCLTTGVTSAGISGSIGLGSAS